MTKPIKTEEQYDEALARAYDLMQKSVGKSVNELDELEILSILIENYETEFYPIPPPNIIP